MGAGQTSEENRVANLSVDIEHTEWAQTISCMSRLSYAQLDGEVGN
jgi:hypothetical protein